MSFEQAEEALKALSTLLTEHPDAADSVVLRWQSNARAPVPLADQALALVDRIAATVPALTTNEASVASLGMLLAGPEGQTLLEFLSAAVAHRELRMSHLLAAAAKRPELRERAVKIARGRVVEGPLADALACAPLLGDGTALELPENAQARARLEILIWEAGASALETPALGPWLFGSAETFETMIHAPARGTLRGRVLAARCLEVSIGGLPPTADQMLVGRTLQVLQPLLLHPEPLVWVHAARALGRLTGAFEQMEGTLLDWVLGESKLLRQRAITAFASLPAQRLAFLGGQLNAILVAPDEEGWVLGAIAAATPYLFFERRQAWDKLAKRILAGDGGAISARALARGLGTLWRRGVHSERDAIEPTLRALRHSARMMRTTTLDESRRWIEVIALTDVVDDAERDPLDLELGLENLMRMAAQYDDEEADARAARCAGSLLPTFQEARKIVFGTGKLRHRAAAINALEASARAFALRLWSPLLLTRPAGEPIDEPDLEETWKSLARAPSEILDLVKESRPTVDADLAPGLPLEVLAIRLGGYALDACGEDDSLGPGRGPTAHDTCLWLRKIHGLADGSRELPTALKNALSSLFWRLVDTTRGTSLGEVDDVRWLGPFAAWWALVIDRPAMLTQLGTALPMMAPEALASCCDRAEVLRTTVSTGHADGVWGHAAAEALVSLHAEDTELAVALGGLARSLDAFKVAAGPKQGLDVLCVGLVAAANRLQGALANPVKALHPAGDESGDDWLTKSTIDNAPRVAALVARAIRARELSLLDVWFASLGPITSQLLEGAISAAIRRTPPPPPKPKKNEPKVVEGYELVKPLGEGGIGSVWLVRKPGADRFFVLKIPKAEALASATDFEREGILASFVEEARALAGLYHPNVANIIDRGVSQGVPFLVLEYLIGADLKQYASAKNMSLFELRHVVSESCAGLAALHGAGLVHRDVKPANIWLRLPLAGGERFEPEKHRDPARAQPLSAVVIDFGMVRAIRVPPDAAGRFVAGTAGYIAPEQVLDPIELDPRADVYALAGTIYNVTTGRAFFDEIESPRDRIMAHMRRDPFEDVGLLKPFPAAIAKLLRAATARDPKDRPFPLELGREFASSL